MTAMDGSRVPSPIWRWRDRREARSVSTACRRRSARNATLTTTFSSRTQRGTMDVTRLDGLVSRMSGPRHRRRADRAARGARQSAVLGDFRYDAVKPSPAQGCELPARRVRGEADNVEIRQAHQVLAGHRAARHPQFGGPGDARTGREWRAQYELHFGKVGGRVRWSLIYARS